MDNGFQAQVTTRISAVIAIALLPFVFYHAAQLNWPVVGLLVFVQLYVIFVMRHLRRGGRPGAVSHLMAALYTFGIFFAIERLGVTATYWLFPAMLSNFYVLPLRSALAINLVAMLLAGLVMHEQPDFAVRLTAALLIMNVFGFVFGRQLAAQRRELNRLSLVDPLTLAQNRRAMDEQLARVVKAKARHGSHVVAVMVDLDHFKRINDRFDHHVGDDVLRAVVDVVRSRLRQTDNLYRYGGEEFVVLASHTDLQEGVRLAEDLRLEVAGHAVNPVGTVTISAGVAELQEAESAMAWISRADEALYAAKRAGRNRVCVNPAPARAGVAGTGAEEAAGSTV